MEIAKYAIGTLLVVGCGAPDVAEYQSGGAREGEQDTAKTLTLGSLESELNVGKKSLEVNFKDCTEFAGLTYVPNERVQDLVPPEYELLHLSGPDEAVVVVRIASCDGITVKKGKSAPGTVAQVGVTMIGPDATSDINNYTLWYVTNHRPLARELSKLGVAAEFSGAIDYAFTPDESGFGAFEVAVGAKHAPDYALVGTAQSPTADAVPFVASWWTDTCKGRVQMRTTLPSIQFGGSTMELTPFEPDLEAVLGAGPVGFPGLDSFNTFAGATMIVGVD